MKNLDSLLVVHLGFSFLFNLHGIHQISRLLVQISATCVIQCALLMSQHSDLEDPLIVPDTFFQPTQLSTNTNTTALGVILEL